MISISTPTYDLDGSRIFTNTSKSDLAAISRRVTRTATLDGGVAIYDGGFAAGDRTMQMVQAKPSQEDRTFCQYILKNYAEIVIACSEGCFSGVPEQLGTDSRGNLKLTILIKEEL